MKTTDLMVVEQKFEKMYEDYLKFHAPLEDGEPFEKQRFFEVLIDKYLTYDDNVYQTVCEELEA